MTNRRWRQRLSATISFFMHSAIFLPTTGAAVTFTVPGNFATIQAAIDAANSGDTILVGPGTYTERLDYAGKNLVVKSTGGPAATILDGGDRYASDTVGITFHGGEDRGAVIDGFTITNCNKAVCFGIWASPSLPRSSPMVFNNLIVDNFYGIHGYVNYHEAAADPLIIGNVIAGNWCGIWLDHQANSYGGADAVIRNNTIVGNSHAGIVLRMHQSLPAIDSNIIALNGIGIEFTYVSAFEARKARVWYNDLWENGDNFYVGDGSAQPQSVDLDGIQGNLVRDPQFADAASRNFHLLDGSPCIDAGNPDADYDDPDGSRNDMGAFGGPPAAADTLAPEAVAMASSWPVPVTPSRDNTVKVIWAPPGDPGLSGLKGYAVAWDRNPDTQPDMALDLRTDVTATTSSVLADGDDHYFHVRAVDRADNWGATTHLGPFSIDSTLPAIRRYRITAVHPPAGFDGCRFNGLNDAGQAVGECYRLDSASGEIVDRQAMTWDRHAGISLLPAFSGESAARAVNAGGQIAGYAVDADGHSRAVRWDDGGSTLLDLGTFYNPDAPVGGQYGDAGAAYGINVRGEVTGYADIVNDAGDFMPFHAFIYDDADGLRDLGTLTGSYPQYQGGYSLGRAIDDRGAVVGGAHRLMGEDWVVHPFLYSEAVGIRALGINPDYRLCEMQAMVISDGGLIGGVLIDGDADFPYYWTRTDVIEPIPVALPAAFPHGTILGVNAGGQGVGQMWAPDGEAHAFVWDERHGIADLNECTERPLGAVLRSAAAINGNGRIVGAADVDGTRVAVLIDPIAACGGDADGDRDVDAADLAAVANDYNRSDCIVSACPGDLDADGAVGESDLAILAVAFGRADCP